MRIAIDPAGRLVVPKAMRDELGVGGAAELEIIASDGRLELTVADVDAHVEMRDGLPVIATDVPPVPLTVEQTRAAIEQTRR